MNTPPPDSLNDRRLNQIAWALAVLAVVVRVALAWRTHSTGEDTRITLRYADNLATGRGFAYNPGERVFGTTTPLYTLLLALAAWMHLPALVVGKGVNILADGLTTYLIARLLTRPEIDRPMVGLFAALLYAVTSTPISISISGMETGLVTCVGLGMVTAYVAGRSRPLYLLGAALYLLRIDGLVLWGLLALALAVRERRIPWRDLGLALLLALPWTLFAWSYFGSPLPGSLLAKLIAYRHGGLIPQPDHGLTKFNRDAFTSQFLLGWVQQGTTALFLVGTAGIIAAAFKARRPQAGETKAPSGGVHTLLVPMLWVLIYYAAMLTSKVPAFGWYFLPPWPLVTAVVGLGAGEIATVLRRLISDQEQEGWRRAWLLILLVSIAGSTLHLPSVEHEIRMRQQEEDHLRLPLGLWLHDHVPPGEHILLEPIGYVGYYSERPIIDAIGLVSPQVLPSYATPNPLADMVRRLQPEWLCLRRNEAAQLSPVGNLADDGRYTLATIFRSSDPRTPTEFLIYRRNRAAPP